MKIEIPVSVGELIDKITILEIKTFFSDNPYIQMELDELNKIKSTLTQFILEYEFKLKKINEKLWEVEDKLRQKEKLQEFDNEFIELARSVYINNDKRAEIKKQINELFDSQFREIKIYQNKY